MKLLLTLCLLIATLGAAAQTHITNNFISGYYGKVAYKGSAPQTWIVNNGDTINSEAVFMYGTSSDEICIWQVSPGPVEIFDTTGHWAFFAALDHMTNAPVNSFCYQNQFSYPVPAGVDTMWFSLADLDPYRIGQVWSADSLLMTFNGTDVPCDVIKIETEGIDELTFVSPQTFGDSWVVVSAYYSQTLDLDGAATPVEIVAQRPQDDDTVDFWINTAGTYSETAPGVGLWYGYDRTRHGLEFVRAVFIAE